MSEPRLFSIGVITACFIDGGTTEDDREALMIRASTGDRENQCDTSGAMLGVGPVHTTSQQMPALSVSRPMVTQVQRNLNEQSPLSSCHRLAAEIHFVCEASLE